MGAIFADAAADNGADGAPAGFTPWFDAPGRKTAGVPIAFGHWSTLGFLERPDLLSLDTGAVHPLTGPVFVEGAQPGDILEIEFTDITPQPTAFSAIMPGLGFLRDVMTEPFLVHWSLKDNWATSAQLPGVRIPGAPLSRPPAASASL